MIRPGSFITFEGGEAVGKSTQIRRLAETLRAAGQDILLTREPGGTPGAEAIRALMLNPATTLAPLADTFLICAARADHVEKLIRPALKRGMVVLCDRFTDSTIAYQGYGLGADRSIIANLAEMIGLTPDLTVILDVPPGIARTRLATRGGSPDRYEQFDAGFASRVAAGYRAIAVSEPERCVLVDASGRIDPVAATIERITRQHLAA